MTKYGFGFSIWVYDLKDKSPDTGVWLAGDLFCITSSLVAEPLKELIIKLLIDGGLLVTTNKKNREPLIMPYTKSTMQKVTKKREV